MIEPEVRLFPDLDALSHAVADHFAALAQRLSADGRDFRVALSGGETPRTFLELLSTEPWARRIPWERVRLYQVDERTVPPDHPESNYGMIRRCLLDRIPEATANFRRMQAERPDLDEAARQYQETLGLEFQPAGERLPDFDFMLLGLGADGHTASLFPGTEALAETERWVVPNFVPQLNCYRMTLTYPVINAAREIVFMVAGEKKAGILSRVLENSGKTLPAQRVQPVAGRVIWYVDREAAQGLRRLAKKTE